MASFRALPADPDSPAAPIFLEAGDDLNAIIEGLAGQFGGTYVGGVPVRFLGNEAAFTFLDDQPAGFLIEDGEFGGVLSTGNIHATEASHEAIASAYEDEFSPVPIPLPAGLPLFLGALGFGALALRRR